ncbi:MAG: IclR family transcriptional regulator C-terminal domain-containing protein [Roseitalea porphyridii]|uniref:IclR family transcriptional regulator n=1 Tax=Roseitalea porphyridii TaxID=1852022 RepID=UPI0032EA98EB
MIDHLISKFERERRNSVRTRPGKGRKKKVRYDQMQLDLREPSSHDGSGERDPLFISSLSKGLSVLQCFGDAWEGLSLKEISQRSELTMAGAQRAVHTLTKLGYLRKDGRTRRYQLAARILDFTYRYMRSSPLYEMAIPVVIGLRDETQETVNISLLDDTMAVLLIRMPSHRRVNPSSVIGRRMPSYAVSTGRAILSRLDDRERSALLDRISFEKVTSRTLVDRAAIETEIAKARDLGYSLVVEQAELGEMALAAPILDGDGRPVAALGITTSTAYWKPEELSEKLAPLVIRAAKMISRSLQGWREIA